MQEAASNHKSIEEYSLAKIKQRLLRDWHPEYEPESFLPPHSTLGADTVSERATLIQLNDIVGSPNLLRHTKVVCTLGPACATKSGMAALIDAGLNIARLNFSHGDHAAHCSMLERFRCALRGSHAPGEQAECGRPGHQARISWFRETCREKAVHCAALLDTKGPEIRTAMLRDAKSISLEQGQSIVVEAVGDRYTDFEGYKDDNETRIGLSYARLCQSVGPGNDILLADGTITIRVDEVLSATELRGTVLNSKELGQRKNCNLPGVKVDLPVLMDKDVHDLQAFACAHGVDFVAASFVQSKADVEFIRATLDAAGGHSIRIISKIENMAGLQNFDGAIHAFLHRRVLAQLGHCARQLERDEQAYSRPPTASWWRAEISAWRSLRKRCRLRKR